MKQATLLEDDLRAEYDETLLKNGVRGKYVEKYQVGVVLLDADATSLLTTESVIHTIQRSETNASI
ncbi:MAG: hypothetical protein HUU38_20710 [Anaerolineales bacterium]|nr:hypothetical protein [Anaerolineales bacterium]